MKIGLNLLHARPERPGANWNYMANIVSTLRLLDCDFLAYCNDISAEMVPRTLGFV